MVRTGKMSVLIVFDIPENNYLCNYEYTTHI